MGVMMKQARLRLMMGSAKRVKLVSTCIRSVQFVKRSGVVFIEFTSGGMYAYEEVKQITVTRLMHSASPGRFYGRNIRGKYQSTKLVL